METPANFISVVIPLYNKELYIKRTLDSVLSQIHTDFECIIVDSSSDRSTDIVREYSDPRIIHIVSPTRIVQSRARNIGIQKARSNYIAFLDADDEWQPDHLKALIRLHQKFPDAGIYTTPYVKIQDNGLEKAMIYADIPLPPWEGYISRYFRTCAKGDVPIHSSSCAVRKDIVKEIGYFDERYCEVKGDEHLWVGEDQHLWARIALQYPVAFTWEGPILYHTEACGRICNEPRKEIIPDPLNHFLKEVINTETLSSEMKKDIAAYIRRREKMLLLSRIVSKGPKSEEDNRVMTPGNPVERRVSPRIILGFGSKLIMRAYQSEWYDRCIRVWCSLHGWHVPVLEKEKKPAH